MLIRMTVDLSGPGLLLGPGDEREFPQDEAVRLIKAGFAVPVAEREIERAVRPDPPEARFSSTLKMPETASRERGKTQVSKKVSRHGNIVQSGE